MTSTRKSARSRSTSPAGRGRRRLLIGFGLLGAGLAAAAVALTVAGTVGSSARLGADRAAAPAAAFRTIDGRDVTLAGLRGQPIALYFMASWCATCVPEAQAWGQIARDGSVQGLQVFVVDVDPVDSAQALAGFRDRYVGGGLDWVLDADQALTRALRGDLTRHDGPHRHVGPRRLPQHRPTVGRPTARGARGPMSRRRPELTGH